MIKLPKTGSLTGFSKKKTVSHVIKNRIMKNKKEGFSGRLVLLPYHGVFLCCLLRVINIYSFNCDMATLI